MGEKCTYSLALAILSRLGLEVDLAILLLSGHNLGVELELEALLCQCPLEGLAITDKDKLSE